MITAPLSQRVFCVTNSCMHFPVNEATFSLTVTQAEAGKRLDKWLSERLAELSRSRIQALLADRRVSTAGRKIDEASYRVKSGENFILTVPPPADAAPRPQPLPLDVAYGDEDIIVINKPAGLVVHPAVGNWQNTLVNALLAHCGDSLSGIGGVRRPGIVHRLDKDTSGLLVAAKTDRAHSGLAAQFAAHTVRRMYLALLWGAPRPAAGRIETLIGRSRANRKKMSVMASGGKHAVTNYELLKRFGDPLDPVASLVRCRLETGRTHQIRVHLAHLGHAVIGDPAYGAGRGKRKALSAEARMAIANLNRQALHAASLGFTHPVSGETLYFESPLPQDLAALIGLLEQIH